MGGLVREGGYGRGGGGGKFLAIGDAFSRWGEDKGGEGAPWDRDVKIGKDATGCHIQYMRERRDDPRDRREQRHVGID